MFLYSTLYILFSDILLFENNTLPKLGDFIKLPTLANTLKTIANSKIGADELYNGSLTKQFVQDIQDAGGIITEEDMANYELVSPNNLIYLEPQITYYYYQTFIYF